MSASVEKQRREEERKNRQQNDLGQTTMISPFARLLTKSLRKTTVQEENSAKLYVENLIKTNSHFLLVGKSTCPRCIQAVELLSNIMEYNLNVIMLDELTTEHTSTTMEAIQDVLWDLTSCRTVPRIFFGQHCLGGYDDVLEKRENNTFQQYIHSLSTIVEVKSKKANNCKELVEEKLNAKTSSLSPLSLNRPAKVTVAYQGITKSLYLLPSLTGLQMKSYVINEFRLNGGFGSYYLRCKDVPFGSKVAINSHTHFGENCHMILEDIGDRPKAVGFT
jgi:glutaredoxin